MFYLPLYIVGDGGNCLIFNCIIVLLLHKGRIRKKFYAGIVLQQLDTDDYECSCECGKFPVANIAIDGWTGSPFKDCPALNKN